MSIPHVVAELAQPWGILPAKLQAIVEVVMRHDTGARLSEPEIRAAIGGGPSRPADAVLAGAIGVLPLRGSIFPRANMITEQSGGTSLQRFLGQFRGFVDDPAVRAIVLDVDSPGGSMTGIPEAFAEIAAARGRKPIVAQANAGLMASAAMYLAAAADEVAASPSAGVGSLGVFYPHLDRSAAMAQAGEKVTLISAGEGKTAGNEFEPLDEEALAQIQKRVNEAYGWMKRDVARGRGVSADTVQKTWKAHLYGAQEAKALGLIDRVATFEETLARLSSGAGRAAAMRAEGAPTEIVAEAPPPAAESSGDLGEAERRLRLARLAGL